MVPSVNARVSAVRVDLANLPYLVGLPGDGKKKHKVETEVSSLTATIIDVVEVGISFHNNFSTGDV